MGMLLVLAAVAAFGMIVALVVHALRADPSPNAHRWLVVVPVLIIAGWIILELIIG